MIILQNFLILQLLTETKEYNKNGEMEGYTVNKYDDKGRMTESQHQNMLFVNSPNQILSQKELYEYDKYGKWFSFR